MINKLICYLLMLLVIAGCSESNNSNVQNHALQRDACAGILNDDSAYIIDEALSASAPWKVGSVVAENLVGDYYTYRRFLGITQSGYYLVQDFYNDGSGVFFSLKKEVIPNEKIYSDRLKRTNPFLVMDEDAVSNSGTNAVCGLYVFWSQKGIRVDEGIFLYGKKEGLWTYWDYGDGNLFKEGRYENGLEQGYWVTYWSGGQQKMFEHFYVNGMQEGPGYQWHENGQLRFLVFMHHNKQQGLLTEWDQNGRIIGQGIFNDGKKVGVWSKWDSQGHLISEIKYD